MICALQTWNPPSASIIALNDHELKNQFDCADDENTITISFFGSGNCKAVGSKSQMSLRWAKVGISRGVQWCRHSGTLLSGTSERRQKRRLGSVNSSQAAQGDRMDKLLRFHQHCVALQCLKHLRRFKRFSRFGGFPNRSSSYNDLNVQIIQRMALPTSFHTNPNHVLES